MNIMNIVINPARKMMCDMIEKLKQFGLGMMMMMMMRESTREGFSYV